MTHTITTRVVLNLLPAGAVVREGEGAPTAFGDQVECERQGVGRYLLEGPGIRTIDADEGWQFETRLQDPVHAALAPAEHGLLLTTTDPATGAPKDIVGRLTVRVRIDAVLPLLLEAAAPAPAPELAPPALADRQAAAVAAVNAEYTRRIAVISTGYPAEERESWPVQTAEARALLADPEASAPWISAAAAARGLTRADLAARIAALDDQYRAVHGALSGARQRLEGQILAATSPEAVAAVAWPAP